MKEEESPRNEDFPHKDILPNNLPENGTVEENTHCILFRIEKTVLTTVEDTFIVITPLTGMVDTIPITEDVPTKQKVYTKVGRILV